MPYQTTSTLKKRVLTVIRELQEQGLKSRELGAEGRLHLHMTPFIGPNLDPQSVTIGLMGEDGPEMMVTIEPELWSALTGMWEHQAESAAYFESAGKLLSKFPELIPEATR